MTEAGRELDALVAEKVMGLSVRFEKGEPSAWRDYVAVCWTPNDYVLLNDDGTVKQIMYLPGGSGAWRVAPYSTDISAAWTVVAKMREHGFLFSAIQFETPDWEIEFHAKSDPLLPGHGTVANARTAELAICKAALEAIKKRETAGVTMFGKTQDEA